MSKAQFELYLSLMRKFLKLDSKQLAALSDELADHYESRREELLDQGLSVPDAEKQAIEELGDATQLAHQLSTLKFQQLRKKIMRTSLAGLTCGALVTIILGFMWAPMGSLSQPQLSISQDNPPVVDGTPAPVPQDKTPTDNSLPFNTKESIANKLEQKIEVNIVDVPLSDVMDFISDQIQVDLVIDKSKFEESGITLDEPINAQLKFAKLSTTKLLSLISQKLNVPMVARVEDGYVLITCLDKPEMIVQVYDVSGLISHMIQFDSEWQTPKNVAPVESRTTTNALIAEQLVKVITTTVDIPWADTDGEGGTISHFDRKLVIRQSPEGHSKIQQVLELLRENNLAEIKEKKSTF